MSSSTSSNSESQSSSSTEPCLRNWLELPREVTASILLRLGTIEMIDNAQVVCTQWFNICKDPSLYRSIDMRNNLGRSSDYLKKLCMHAVDRSCGGLVDIDIESFGTDELLSYITQRTSHLRRVRLALCPGISDAGLSRAASRLPMLEELEIHFGNISKYGIEVVGRCCPLLKTFKFSKRGIRYPFDDEALAIAQNMHGLHHLHIVGNKLTNEGLEAILNGCPRLESLDLRRCFLLDLRGDIGRRCAERIRNLRRPSDSIDDYEFAAEVDGVEHPGNYYVYDGDDLSTYIIYDRNNDPYDEYNANNDYGYGYGYGSDHRRVYGDYYYYD
ncbi:hypothetical protein PTKIN_Ptkin02bG0251000 [Pterospermum kingtungense]